MESKPWRTKRDDFRVGRPRADWRILRSGRAWALRVLLFVGLFLVGSILDHLGPLPDVFLTPGIFSARIVMSGHADIV